MYIGPTQAKEVVQEETKQPLLLVPRTPGRPSLSEKVAIMRMQMATWMWVADATAVASFDYRITTGVEQRHCRVMLQASVVVPSPGTRRAVLIDIRSLYQSPRQPGFRLRALEFRRPRPEVLKYLERVVRTTEIEY